MAGNKKPSAFYLTVGANIRRYRQIRNYSLEVLGEKIGLKKKQVSRYEQGENNIDMDRMGEIAAALDIPLAQLLQGTEAYIGDRVNGRTIIKLPILGFVPAGGPVMVEENLEGYTTLDRFFVKGDNDFCLMVRGDSMENVGIYDGDMVLVHPQPVAENGQTVIARVNGEVTCKRFYRTDGHCRLEPANKKYKPIPCDDVEIVGIVTKVIKEIS